MEPITPATPETPTQEKNLIENLRLWAAKHVEAYHDLILMDGSAMELTDLTLTAQQPDTRHIHSEPVEDLKEIKEAVTSLDARFLDMLDILEFQEAKTGSITSIGNALEEKKNVIVDTNHAKITDLGLVLAAYVYSLRSKGFEFQTGTIVSKMAPFLGCQFGEATMSLTDVLAMGCDDIFLGYPVTDSTTEAGIPTEVADSHNYKMLKMLIKKMDEGGNLLVIDPTGTTNKEIEGVVTIAPISSATVGILSRKNNLVTPAGVWFSDNNVTFVPEGKLYTITRKHSDDDSASNMSMESFMDHYVKLLNGAVDPAEARFVYNPSSKEETLGRVAAKSLIT